MAFYGLFVGINRHSSKLINELSFARRDAVAMHALFTDTLGGDTKLLTDEEATRAAIEEELGRLTTCSKDDVVVISFSGHGAPTHQLVTYDADRRNLEGTCIPLDVFAGWLSRIPARRLVCILDCCFSGGMGAKGLDVESTPRDPSSVEELLDQMSGEGRLIFTASTSTEKAWENAKLRHGLLTHHLLEALQGAEEVVQGAKISLYRLLEHVTRRVIDFSSRLGKTQNPTVRGTLDGDITWPVFTPGELYRKAFPELVRRTVTQEIQSLAAYGFPQGVLDAWAGAIPSLNQLQLDAVNEYALLDGEHLVVSAPTSSGKTMIGELAALKGALERRRAFFLLPLKALVNDKLRHFNNVYGAFGIRTIKATGDSTTDDMAPLMRGQYDICLMTYEKFAALALGNPFLLDQVGTVVVDEVQMVTDKSRGANLEFVLTLLRIGRRHGTEPQFIALSAVIGDTNGLERWLGARLLQRTERPVPIDEGILRSDGSFRYISSDTGEEKVINGYVRPEYRSASDPRASQNYIIPLTRRLVGESKSVIVFRETKGKARGCARYLAQSLGLPPAQAVIDSLPAGDPSTASSNLRETLQGGVAFHIADLDTEERQLIEDEFRSPNSSIRVIAATTTLAMGVNTPAEAVIIAGLTHPGDNPQPYSVAEYKNIAGRAGRLPFTDRGASYLLALSPHEEEYFWTNYVKGQPEDLTSRFLAGSTDQRSLILRVLASAPKTVQGLTADEIIAFLEESFGAFQRRQKQPDWSWDKTGLLEALHSLKTHQLVEVSPEGRYRPSELGRFAGEAGVEVESIVRLVDAFRRLGPDQINDPALITAAQLTVELDDVYFPINKRGAAKENQTWTSEIRLQSVPQILVHALGLRVADTAQGARRAKKAAACLLWISDLPMSHIENVLTKHGGRFDGASGSVLATRARTCDLLPTVSKVAAIVHPSLDLNGRMERLLTRLEVGVPPAAVDLATHAGSRLARGDYRSLLEAGLCSIEAIENCLDEELLKLLSGNKAKLSAVRAATKAYRRQQDEHSIPSPIIPPYES
jgi:replicative superfamily II helicase